MVKIKGTVSNHGNGLMIYIPLTISREMKFARGDVVLMDIVDEKLVMEKL